MNANHVNMKLPFSRGKRAPICRLYQFLWCKFSHSGEFLASSSIGKDLASCTAPLPPPATSPPCPDPTIDSTPGSAHAESGRVMASSEERLCCPLKQVTTWWQFPSVLMELREPLPWREPGAFTLLPSRFWGFSDAQRLYVPQFRGARERKTLLETDA